MVDNLLPLLETVLDAINHCTVRVILREAVIVS